jgi:uncharacterized protein YdeI (YjbR/CyaY-like superfamily)
MNPTGPLLHLKSAVEWRAWLEEHHSSEKEAWVVFYRKHTGKPWLTYEEAMDGALSFGWVDSVMRRIDDASYALRYSPRRKGSNWSESNRNRVARLIEEGRMTEAGMAKVEEAKRNGKWG